MEPTQKKDVILAATDFTHIGDYAIDNAAALAKVIKAKVLIVHVINKQTKKRLRAENKGVDHIRKELLDEAEKLTAAYEVEAEFETREGSIFTGIAQIARERDVRYVVLGTHGKIGIQRLLGSFALKVIKRSPAPVLSVKKPSEGNVFRNFVYPLDLELGSKQKVKWANHLSKLAGSTFQILVYNPSDKAQKNKMKADLNQVTRIMHSHGVKHTITYAEQGKPFSPQIVRFAVDQGADAIMISTDPGKISWAMYGSADEKVIYNEEKIPVLCINAKDLNLIIGGM
ncbi:MAG: universal stress protein [Bacteroidales bacterium]